MVTQDVLQASTHLSDITLMSNTVDGPLDRSKITQLFIICKY